MSLSLDKITQADAESLRNSLTYLTDNDHECTYKVDIRQGGFSLHVKVDGKPGVDSMLAFCNTFLAAPDTLHDLLTKLFHEDTPAPSNPITQEQDPR